MMHLYFTLSFNENCSKTTLVTRAILESTPFQVQEWTGNEDLDPEAYGWTLKNGLYNPDAGYTQVCPQSILKLLSCKCKAGCATNSCGCRNVGLKCTDICQCSDSCTNGAQDDNIDNEVEFEAYDEVHSDSDNDETAG